MSRRALSAGFGVVVRGIALATSLLVAPPLYAQNSPSRRHSPGPRRGTHCLVLTLLRPSPRHLEQVAARLRAEGYSAGASGGFIELYVTATELARLFGARFITYQQSRAGMNRIPPPNASPTYTEVALSGGRVPARYRRDIEDFSIGHQICE